MSYSVTAPSSRTKLFSGFVVGLYALVTLAPLLWIIATGFKSGQDSIHYPPKVLFEPTLEGYVNLFTTRTRIPSDQVPKEPSSMTWYEEMVDNKGEMIAGPSKYGDRFLIPTVIGFGSTALCMLLGTMAAYAFSRFKVPFKDDLLFFILSTRMMPPIAVAIPIFLMFKNLGLNDTYLGMIMLYTAVNLSLSVWLLKGFMDEIPVEYEEAALIDGYTPFKLS